MPSLRTWPTLAALIISLSFLGACGKKKKHDDDGAKTTTPAGAEAFQSLCKESGGTFRAAATDPACECGGTNVNLSVYSSQFFSKDNSGSTFKNHCAKLIADKKQAEKAATEAKKKQNDAATSAQQEAAIRQIFTASCQRYSAYGARIANDVCECNTWRYDYNSFRNGSDAASYRVDRTGSALAATCGRALGVASAGQNTSWNPQNPTDPSAPINQSKVSPVGSCSCRFELSNGYEGYHLCTLRDASNRAVFWIYQPEEDFGTYGCQAGCEYLAIKARYRGLCQ